MKHLIYILLLTSSVFLYSGCSFYQDNSTKADQTSIQLPDNYKTIALTDIYGNLSAELKEKMTINAKSAIISFGLPEISDSPAQTRAEDDPNLIKAYAAYRLAQNEPEIIGQNKDKKIDSLMDQLVSDYPENITAQKVAAQRYKETDKIYAAIRHAKKALELDPNDIEAGVLCAEYYADNQRFENSLKYATLALHSPQASVTNEQTAKATLYQAIALEKLGYTLAAAQQHLKTWQLMKYHRRFGHYDESMNKLLGQSEFQLLLAARNFLQCGMIEQCSQTLDMVQYGPDRLQLIGYLTPIIIDLPESQHARFTLLKSLYRFSLATGDDPGYILQMFYNNCEKMALTGDYITTLKEWYNVSETPASIQLISRHHYAIGLEYAKQHTMARLVLKNSSPSPETAATWLYFARLDRLNKAYDDMLNEYIRCIDSGPIDLETVILEFENILKLDQPASQALSQKSFVSFAETNGRILIQGMIAEYNKRENQAEKYLRLATKRMPDSQAVQKCLIKHLARTGQHQNILILTRRSNDKDMLIYAARACQSLNNYVKAEYYYTQVLTEDKFYEPAITNLAALYIAQERFSEAETMLLRTARRFPEYDSIQQALIKLYAVRAISSDSSPKTAELCQARFKELTDKWSIRYSDSPARQKNAELLLQANLEELLKVYDNCTPAREIICRSYLKTDNIDNAVIHARKLLKKNQDNPELLTLAADIFAQAQKFDLEITARKAIWNHHWQTNATLSDAMTAARMAGLPSESLDLLHDGVSKLENNINFISDINNEANFTFLILRDYQQAVDLYNIWLKTIIDNVIDNNKELYCITLQRLAVFNTYAQNYQQAHENIKQLYTKDNQYSLYAAYTLVRSLNIRGMFNMSLKVLDSLIEIIPPDDIFLYHEYAFTLIDAELDDKAVDFILNWQKQRPDATNRQYVLLQTYQRCGRWQDAINLLQQQLRETPNDPDLLTQCAYNLIQIGDENSLNEAAGILDELERSNIDPFKWFDYRIILDITRNQPQIALEHLTAMGADSNAAATQAVIARIYFLNGENDKALNIYKKLIEEKPDDAELRNQYSFVLETAGQIDAAIEQMEIVRQMNPNNAMSQNNLAYTMIVHNKDIERAGTLIRQAIYRSPGNVAILDSVGWYYYKQGKFETAMDYIYHAASADTIVDPVVMDHLGDCLYRLGESDRAAIYWQRGLDEIERRLTMEKYLNKEKDRIAEKIRQYKNNDPVQTAELFSK